MWERRDNQEVGLEAAILQRKRNSSLVKRACAKNVTGLKHDAEAAGSGFLAPERSGSIPVACEGRPARTAGGTGSDYADTSSDKMGEKPIRRKSKVSWVKVICSGLVGA
jgi:hypothetical protein